MIIKVVKNGLAYYLREDLIPAVFEAGADARSYKEAAEFVIDVRENKVIKANARLEAVVDSHIEQTNILNNNKKAKVLDES